MATLTITISNTLGVYAAEPTTKWDAFVWDVDPWTWRDIEWTFDKLVEDTLSLDSTNTFFAQKKIDESLIFDTLISRQFGYSVFETMGLSSAITIVQIINNGWTLTKGSEENALDWPISNFSLVTDPTTTWAEVSNPTTTWVQS